MTAPSSIAPPVADVLGRIAGIQARFSPTPQRAGSGSTASLDPSFAGWMDALSPGGVLGATSTDASSGLDTTGGTAGGGVDGTSILSAGSAYLGVPYRWGGTDPATGLDCSGFVQRVFGDLGIDLPRVSRDQAKVGTEVPSLAQAQPGDLIAFGRPTVTHIAIYAGDGKIMHAPHTGAVVSVTPIRRNDIASIRRVTGGAGTGGAAALGAAFGSPLGSVGSARTGRLSPGATASLGANVPYGDLFVAAGQKYGLDPALLASVAKVESGFNPTAGSPAGARGLMQFMPATAAGMGIDPMDPAQAIDGAARYLTAQLNRFGSLDKALAAYNAGPGAVQRAGGVPPYPETQSYVKKVRNTMEQYAA
jgi:cell wall-associated NlpC family hydrolase